MRTLPHPSAAPARARRPRRPRPPALAGGPVTATSIPTSLALLAALLALLLLLLPWRALGA